eukprot:1154661-Pelagomonas_calceolata.AAC.3
MSVLPSVSKPSASRAFPDWPFPNGTSPSALNQSRPDAAFVHSIPGRPSHIDPTKILPRDRGIHLANFKFCPDDNPFPTLCAATAEYAGTKTAFKTRSSRYPNRDNSVTLQITLVGVAGTIYNENADYTSYQPGTNQAKGSIVSIQLSCHAVQELPTIINTRHDLHFRGLLRGGDSWARGGGEQEKGSLDAQEHG